MDRLALFDIDCTLIDAPGAGGRAVLEAIVATGRHTVAQLAAHAPDYVFADMGNWRAVYEAILA